MTIRLLFLKDHSGSSVEELKGERLEVQIRSRAVVEIVQVRES